ncbi:hypothetical protein DIPPA_03904 [Diplonema papillatum]|nr:hypothetical protein DIPPA_03904 [Diplonema papillatum]
MPAERLFFNELLNKETYDKRRRFDVIWAIDEGHGDIDGYLGSLQSNADDYWGLVVSSSVLSLLCLCALRETHPR